MSSALSKWKKLALSLGIVIVINVFFNVGIETFYPAPRYENFCSESDMKMVDTNGKDLSTLESCQTEGGTWVAPATGGNYCQMDSGVYYTQCNEAYQTALQPYQRNGFIALTVLGTLTLLVGLLAGGLPMAVANGLLYGGILSIVIGTMRYWTYMEDYLQFIVSGIALFLLILVGIKRLKD